MLEVVVETEQVDASLPLTGGVLAAKGERFAVRGDGCAVISEDSPLRLG
jgi:hypothetical protein